MTIASTASGPPNGIVFPKVSGYTHSNGSNATASNRASWSGSQGSVGSYNGVSRRPPRFSHIKDLQSLSQTETRVSIHSSMGALLDRAEQCAKKAEADVGFKRPDRAYVEWLISSDIIINLIPRHHEYPSLNQNRGCSQRYKSLYKQNDSQHKMFKEIHDMIAEDNASSGIAPSNLGQPLTSPSPLHEYTRQTPQTSPRPLSMPDAADFRTRTDLETQNRVFQQPATDEVSSFRNKSSRQPPPVHPKPNGMHAPSRASNESLVSVSSDRLAERFAKLRLLQSNTSDLPHPTRDLGIIEINSSDQRSVVEGQASKPSGPRVMPHQPSYLPPKPPKIPIDASLSTALPRAPSPAYNPARNLQSPPNITPPRTTARSLTMNSARSSQLTQYSSERSDDIPVSRQPEWESFAKTSKLVSPDLQNLTAISAEELYERVRAFHVLLIDLRSREDFDQGHIFAKSIICVEPISLTIGTSADEVEERLVVSPEAEQSMFERRNEYDLVVYYDQSTQSNAFLAGQPDKTTSVALRALYEALYEFNYYKELRRPPAFLLGGLDAWTDLVGPQALQTSRTAVSMGLARSRRPPRGSGRPIARLPMASANSSLEVRKRRLREHNPLDAEEQRTWLEKTRMEEAESADYHQAHNDGDTDSASSQADEPISPLIHSYEDFLRKFPEPSAVQQSMTSPALGPPSRPPPALPRIPLRPPPAVARPSYSGVSERDSSQLSPTSRQPVSSQPPLYTSRSISHYLKLPRTGLINFSVTCYMNATIQCLLATIPLSQFFLDNRWRDFTQKNWKGSNGVMPEIYATLIRTLWRNDVTAVRPTSLRNFCARLNPEWGVDRQQDAKEFFDFLVDCLHEDLNISWERSPLQPLTAEQEMYRESMPLNKVSKKEWERYTHRESSFISNLFAGQHASMLRCKTCRTTSTTYEAFYSISVEIPRSGRGDIRECLRSYCQEEMLSGDEVWKCPHCKCEREATKRITLTRLPQVLVIHFKRFSASKTESARKVHTPIEFPLYGLNMEPFMAPTQLDMIGTEGKVDNAITPPFQYDAYAVMRHLGQTGNGGHYIALVRDAARSCWRKFDDERATDFDPNKVRVEQRLQNEQAYIVFYGRSAAR